jgi:hypothetical protein
LHGKIKRSYFALQLMRFPSTKIRLPISVHMFITLLAFRVSFSVALLGSAQSTMPSDCGIMSNTNLRVSPGTTFMFAGAGVAKL